MEDKTTRHLTALLLLVVSVVSWWYVITTYQGNKANIVITVADIAREIALPFHIARLSFHEPTTVLPVPVYGTLVREVADTWNEARSEGRTHEGTDIFAERGTPVFSATEGYVVRLNIGMRGGKNVMVVGPGGLYYYYAHFDRIALGIDRGTPVTLDTVLGFVGNSGNATGTPPHLHFGIYPAQWDAVNPYPLLIDRW
jgi:murein DD-endopeptidase MepM/ murein hydrolase activator NlpD